VSAPSAIVVPVATFTIDPTSRASIDRLIAALKADGITTTVIASTLACIEDYDARRRAARRAVA
jgi:hypothetical protein